MVKDGRLNKRQVSLNTSTVDEKEMRTQREEYHCVRHLERRNLKQKT